MCRKWLFYDWLGYPNQNTQKTKYLHTTTQMQIPTDRKCNTTRKCNTIYKIQTTMSYIYWPILVILPFLYIHFISYIRYTMCTLHTTILVTYFTRYFVQTRIKNAKNYTIYIVMYENVGQIPQQYKSQEGL
ncbi:p110_11L_2 [African swine fever virus]|uniref:p110_11L_2 n=1 Tax=African swine fever virus TaxID=10497 RepID=A0A6G7KU66_ASF|nr:p110_11L_2 [African swine fever virus]